jgi:excisionase family DNA binding protein
MSEVEGLYSPRGAAHRLGVSERTIRRWIGEGRLPARRYGRQLRIAAAVLEEFGETAGGTADSWAVIAADTFTEDWDNALDGAYDDWRELYAVPPG